MTDLKEWARQNSTLVYFLIAQAIAIGAAVLSMTAYMVKLETRVVTLETRGSPHLNVIDGRLIVLENRTENNEARINRLVDKATK